MMKNFLFVLFIFFHAFLANAEEISPPQTKEMHIITSAFEPDLCLNGYAGSWTGACICFQKGAYPNRYCNPNFKQIDIHQKVTIKDKTFVLSGGIVNWDEANKFCSQLKKGYKLATREDFNCKKTGIGCLDNKIFIPIKEKYGHRGFFWLEESENTEKAYYADLNDGTVYNTAKSNSSTMQALCVKED